MDGKRRTMRMGSRQLPVLPTCAMAKQPGDLCPCSLEGVVNVLGKKWAILVVGTLGNHGRLRFNELQGKLGGISPKSLTERLRELEREGLVTREASGGFPPRAHYALSAAGREMWRAMLPMMRWALRRDHNHGRPVQMAWSSRRPAARR